jgi:hypothetical protein
MGACARRIVAAVILATSLAGLALPLVSSRHLQEFDPDVDTIALGPGHLREQFEARRVPAEFEHCALCHWLRDLARATPPRGMPALPTLTVAARPFVRLVWHYASPSSLTRSSRAPPITL